MKRRMNITLDEESAKKLKELAERDHTNMSQWITAQIWKEARQIEAEERNDKRNEGSL